MDEKSFGANVRARRKRLGWTQGRLAKEIHVSTDYISRIEKGERTPSERVKIDLDDFILGLGRFSSLEKHSAAGGSAEGHGGYIEAVAAMMREMDEETQKDIFLSVQKEKLLRDLLTEREQNEPKKISTEN